MDSPKTLGRIGAKVIAFYLVTTVFAAIIGIVIGDVFKPGIGFEFQQSSDTVTEVASLPTIQDFVLSLFSENIFYYPITSCLFSLFMLLLLFFLQFLFSAFGEIIYKIMPF